MDNDRSDVEGQFKEMENVAAEKNVKRQMMAAGGCVGAVLLVVALVSKGGSHGTAEGKAAAMSMREEQAMEMSITLSGNLASGNAPDMYHAYLVTNGEKGGGFKVRGVASYSDDRFKHQYRLAHGQATYEMFALDTGKLQQSRCMLPSSLPPLKELLHDVMFSENAVEVEKDMPNCQDGKTLKFSWADEAMVYCLKEVHGKEHVTEVFGVNMHILIKYDTDKEEAMKHIQEKPMSMKNEPLTCHRKSGRRLAAVIDFTYNSQAAWSYDSISATLTSQNYMGDGADLTAKKNRFDFTNNMYDSQMYAKDRHHNTLYSTVDLINLLHGAGVRRLQEAQKMTCVFVHGFGVVPKEEGLFPTSQSNYWGDFQSEDCSEVLYMELDTWNNGWDSSKLSDSTCKYLLEAESDKNCDSIVDNIVIITHGSAALQVAHALSSGKCQLGSNSKLIPIQAPVKGYSYMETILKQCGAAANQDSPAITLLPCNNKVLAPGALSLQKNAGNKNAYTTASTYLSTNGFGRLCGLTVAGMDSPNLKAAVVGHHMTNGSLYGNDGMTSKASCISGIEKETFHYHPHDLYYSAFLSMVDGTLHSGDSFVHMDQQPKLWLSKMIHRASESAIKLPNKRSQC